MRSFGIAPLDLEGEDGLLELALEALVRGEEEDLGELLGDRASALHDAAPAVVLDDGAADADGIDAPVVVEASVLRGDDGVLERPRHLAERDEDAALDVQFGDEVVVLVVDLGALERFELLQGRDRGQGLRQDGERPQRADPEQGHDEEGEEPGPDENAAQPGPTPLDAAPRGSASLLCCHRLPLYRGYVGGAALRGAGAP